MSSTDEKRLKIVVVGAGIAGLATAYLLRESSRTTGRNVEVTILEAAGYHGGSTRTEQKDGYLCEWGPNGFLDNEPATFKLIRQLDMENQLVKANENASRRFIFHGGALRQLPMSPPAFIISDILPLISRLRVMLELLIPQKKDGADETVAAFGRRRLGNGFTRYLLDPMVSGIFAGDIDKLSLKAVFPKMVEMESEYGGLFKALIAKMRQAKKDHTKSGGPSGPDATLHTFKKGMGQLTDRLAEQLAGAFRPDQPVLNVSHHENGFQVRTGDATYEADCVVLACPSYAAAEMISDLSPEVSQAIGEIYHAPVDVVCHGYKEDDFAFKLNGFGVLIPRSEGIRSLGTLWSDSIFPGQAPEGYKLLRTLLGGAHDPEIVDLSAMELHKAAHLDHQQVLDVRGVPSFNLHFRHPRGIAQYNTGHLIRVNESEKLENELPGLFFTGASYRGVSVNGCIKDAYRVVRTFWEQQGGVL